jgi:class 3 adenylate cyclase
VRNYRRAYEINQEAFAFFSNKGTSISDLESKYETQKLQIEKEKKELEKERDKLAFEVANLEVERDQLTTDKSSLEQRQEQLVREKQKVEQEISTKEEKLAEVSTEKEKAVEIIRKKEEEVKDLTREALEQRTVLAETELDLKETQLVAEQNRNLRNLTFFAAGFILVLAMLFYGRFRSNKKANKILAGKNAIIENERKRSDELLLNILPATIAGELKEFGKARAHRYEEVTVLFSDFRNFTAIAEKLSPEELVEELDKCFKAFDFIISQYEDIEKIKTIGDAYMCASGLTNQQTYPDNIVRAAIEMQEFLHEQKQERMRLGKPFFEARIGIHTGPAVAGVVGVKKFAYDIWGDTVNIASRMEIHCEPGRVNISEVTYNKVSYKFECEYRGKVEAKNKGAIDMYYVIKERAAIAV